MKTWIFLFLMSPLWLWAKPQVIRPLVKTPASFAIIIDRQSFEQARDAVEAYRDAIEKDGLAAYILVDDWQNPEEIRKQLKQLHEDRKMPLEGAVLVGDIPIPMIRDAQFLSSAFKMDQRRPWNRSSIPSDRYYDDFDLRFTFLKQDSLNPLYFYYSLCPESPMYIQSDIYSARIKPMARDGKSKYEILERYLRKVVRLKAEVNPLNDLTVARGHGYNSEAREAWSGEQLALREQFPELFKTGNYIRFYDFDFIYPAKIPYLSATQRETADVVLFHHHGSDDLQYINGYPEGSGVQISLENVKRYLRSKVAGAKERGKDVEKTKQEYHRSLGVPLEWMENTFDPEVVKQDSVFNANLDIHLSDVHALRPNARFIMFDACFNGSFYEDDCIASAYIFGEGNTVVTQANTVNTIQDKWPDEYLGLLSSGVRVGQWGRHVHFLETHIIGDPTYHFANTVTPDLDMNRLLVREQENVELWYRLAKHASADVQAIALRKLYENQVKDLGVLLKNTYQASPYGVVRMECMKLLYEMNSPELVSVLEWAVGDSYELVRRFAACYIGKIGADELIPAVVHSLLNDRLSTRVNYQAREAAGLLDPQKVIAEIEKQLGEGAYWVDQKSLGKSLTGIIQRGHASWKHNITVLEGTASDAKDKRFEISRHRNLPYARSVKPLIHVALDPGQDMELRILTVEALSWYNHSVKREEIIQACEKIIARKENPALVDEAVKTKNRLTVKPL